MGKKLGPPSIKHLLSFPAYIHDVLHRTYRKLMVNCHEQVNPVHGAIRERVEC